jgi:hypothetical protein
MVGSVALSGGNKNSHAAFGFACQARLQTMV